MQQHINHTSMSFQLNTRNLLLPFISCLLPLLVSCQSGLDEASSQEGECTVNFLVTNYRQISFDDIASSGQTRAVASDHPTTLAHLQIAIYDVETGKQACPLIRHDQSDYTREDQWESYRQFSVTLPYGHYRVLVLGYNGSRACNITSLNHISWAEDYVPNTFLYCEEFTLNEGANLNKRVTLKHLVAAFRVMSEDLTPNELKKMRFISTAGGTVLDAMTGFTTQNTGRTSDIVVPSNHLGIRDTFTVYLFLPEEQIIVDNYTVQALGQGDAVLYQKRFSNVPLRINYLTEWEGKFFEKSTDEEFDAGISVYWETKWADTLKINP